MPVSRSTVQGGTSDRSPLDLIIPDPLLRGSSSWEVALSGEEVRGSGWPVRDVLDVLASRLSRYYSLKGSDEDELDAMRAEVEELSEKNASLHEENGELFRSSVVYRVVKRRRGNDGFGSGRGFLARGGCICGETFPRLGRGFRQRSVRRVLDSRVNWSLLSSSVVVYWRAVVITPVRDDKGSGR